MSMTSRQRLLTAWRKEIPDRVPVYIRGVHILDDRWRSAAHRSYEPLIAEVDEHCDKVLNWTVNGGFYLTRNKCAPRAVETVPVRDDYVDDRVTVQTPAGPLLSVIRRSLTGEPGMCLEHFIADEEDMKKFSIPYERVEQEPASYFEADRRVGERGITLVCLGMNPLGGVYRLLGSETLAVWSVTHRDRITTLLGELVKRYEALIKDLLSAGVGPLFSTLGHECCLPPLQSPADFDEFIVKVDKPFMDLIHDAGGMVHVHCHSNLRDVLDGFLQLAPDIMHPFEAPPMGDITLADAKERVRGSICIEGNMQIGDLLDCTPEEIREKTAQIIEDAAQGGGLILCPTASPFEPVLSDRMLENYRAFIHTGLELGAY